MRQFLLLTTFFLVCFHLCFAQNGSFYLTDHSPHLKEVDAVNFDIAQDQQHIIYVANRAGVLKYQGLAWKMIPTPSAAFSISIGKNNEIYVGCLSGFGKLVSNEMNQVSYQELSVKESGTDNIFESLVDEKNVYFLSDNALYIVDQDTNEILTIHSPPNSEFINILNYENEIIIISDDGTLEKLEGNRLVSTKKKLKKIDKIYSTIKNPNKDEYIIGTSSDKLYIGNDAEYREIQPDESWADQKLDIIEISWIDNDLIAVATLNHGCLFINPRNGKLINRVDYHSGLPDNEIFSMYADHEGGIWLSHESGITRVSPKIPLRSFNHFPGLEGNLLTAQEHNGKLYVSTSLGVFYLDKKNEYAEVVNYVKKVSTSKVKTEPVTKAKRKKGLFRKKKKSSSPEKQTFETTQSISYQKNVKKELVASYYMYHKVSGISTKSKQLIPFNKSLLVGAKDGIYEIKDDKSELLLGFPLKYLYLSSNEELLLASTEYSELQIMIRKGKSWAPHLTVSDFDEDIQHITEDDDGVFWLSGTEHIYRLFIENGEHEIEKYNISNPHYDQIVSITIEGKQSFVNSTGISTIDNSGLLKKDDKNGLLTGVEKIIYSFPNHLWLFKLGKWSRMSYSSQAETKLDYLNLFDGVRHIFENNQKNILWIITDYNQLFQYNLNQSPPPTSSPLLMSSITRSSGENIMQKSLEITRDKSSISFSVMQPDYLMADKIEYQYLLSGLSKDWSTWSKSTSTSFPFIPSGKYKLMVKSRNIFGQEQLLEPYAFKVLPPFWERPWFYALEVAFFGGLLLLSIQFNKRQEKLNWLSKILTYITLVFTIEFLQTVGESKLGIESESPVEKFFITAFIALCIFPLEQILRKFISRDTKKAPSES